MSVKFRTFTMHNYDGRLDKRMAEFLVQGWNVCSPPHFSYLGPASGFSEAAVGKLHPHFTVTMIHNNYDEAEV